MLINRRKQLILEKLAAAAAVRRAKTIAEGVAHLRKPGGGWRVETSADAALIHSFLKKRSAEAVENLAALRKVK